MDTLTQSGIIDALVASKKGKLSRAEAEDVTVEFFDIIRKALVKGQKVRLEKIGMLLVRKRPARNGRNPRTAEVIKLPATKSIAFRLSSTLKRKLNNAKK